MKRFFSTTVILLINQNDVLRFSPIVEITTQNCSPLNERSYGVVIMNAQFTRDRPIFSRFFGDVQNVHLLSLTRFFNLLRNSTIFFVMVCEKNACFQWKRETPELCINSLISILFSSKIETCGVPIVTNSFIYCELLTSCAHLLMVKFQSGNLTPYTIQLLYTILYISIVSKNEQKMLPIFFLTQRNIKKAWQMHTSFVNSLFSQKHFKSPYRMQPSAKPFHSLSILLLGGSLKTDGKY